MKNGKIIIRIIIVFVGALLFYTIFFPPNKRLRLGPPCSEEYDMKKLDLNGIILSKYNDSSNHMYSTIVFQDRNTKAKLKVYFINESSGFFDLIEPGDTVIKKPNTLEIFSNNKNIKSILVYDCPDE